MLRLTAFLLVVSVLLVVLLLLAVPLLRTPPLVAPPLPLLAPAQCWPSRHAPMYWLSSKLCCPAPITTANCLGWPEAMLPRPALLCLLLMLLLQ